MTQEEVRRFLAQFPAARKSVKQWPQWMQNAAREASAHFPRPTQGRDSKETDHG